MALAADQGIVAVQLQRYLALRIDGGLVGAAGVDVHVVQRDRCGNALIGVDGRRVVRRLVALGGQGDRRFVFIVVQVVTAGVFHILVVRIYLGDISAVALGVHGHAALGQVVGVRKSRRSAGRHHCQKRGGGKHPQSQTIGLFLHKNTPSFVLQWICILPCVQKTARRSRNRKRVGRPCTAQIIVR